MPKKNEQFQRAGSYSYSSGLVLDLIVSTNALMIAAARERRPGIFMNIDNHASQFAPGADRPRSYGI